MKKLNNIWICSLEYIVFIVVCITSILVLSCARKQDGSTQTLMSQEEGEYSSKTSEENRENNYYYVPSDYDILNTLPHEVQTYLKGNKMENIETLLNDLDIDITDEIATYLEEASKNTKTEIFSHVP